jgi:hypothetical protein
MASTSAPRTLHVGGQGAGIRALVEGLEQRHLGDGVTLAGM